MINLADKSSISSRLTNQAKASHHPKQRKKSGAKGGDADNTNTWCKRAAGWMTMGLLAAQGASARALLPPSHTMMGLGGRPRALLQNCPADQAAMGTANATWLQSAGPYVNAVASNESWTPIAADACAPPYSVALTYSFDAPGDILPSSVFGDAATLDSATQATLARDFDDITASVGLIFSPFDNTTSDVPNLVLLRNADVNSSVAHFATEGPGYVDSETSYVMYTEPAGIAPRFRLAGLGYALGLKGIGAAGAEGFGLPVGNFGDTALSSVTASKDNACWPVTRLGPLDLAFLAQRHGLAPLLSEIEAIELDETYGTGGLLLSPYGLTTLAVSHPGQVTISLADDGSSATHINGSVILLAPGSLAGGADATATQGAWLIGNNGDTMLTGSDSDDFFSVGANVTLISTGLGKDSILIDDSVASSVSVVDFDPFADSIWVSPNTASAGAPAQSITVGDLDVGATLQTPGGATVRLLNTTSAELPALSTFVFSGVPATLEPFKIDLCQGLASAAAPAPTPTPALAPAPVASVPTAAPNVAPVAMPTLAPRPGAAISPAAPILAPAPIGPSLAAGAFAPGSAEGSGTAGPPQPQDHHTSKGGVIAGAIIGTSAAVLLAGGLGWVYTQRRRSSRIRSQSHNRFERFVAERRGVEMQGLSFGAQYGSRI